jgi:hypothetical protein
MTGKRGVRRDNRLGDPVVSAAHLGSHHRVTCPAWQHVGGEFGQHFEEHDKRGIAAELRDHSVNAMPSECTLTNLGFRLLRAGLTQQPHAIFVDAPRQAPRT